MKNHLHLLSNKYLIVVLFFLLYVSINAQPIYVNSAIGNDATGDGSSGNPYKTFTKGYNLMSSGGTLDLTGTFTWTDASETGDAATSGFTIAKNITIQGNSSGTLAIIQAASASGTASNRIFTIGSNAVTFKNLELRYGNPPDPIDGGGLSITGTAAVTIDNCYIHDNHARQGGGIYIWVAMPL